MLKELRRGWALGSEEFRDRMSDLASGIVRGRKRESYSGEEVRRYDETRPVNCSRADSIG
jgi:hypothetical protein